MYCQPGNDCLWLYAHCGILPWVLHPVYQSLDSAGSLVKMISGQGPAMIIAGLHLPQAQLDTRMALIQALCTAIDHVRQDSINWDKCCCGQRAHDANDPGVGVARMDGHLYAPCMNDAQMQASQGLLDVGEHCVYRSKWSF